MELDHRDEQRVQDIVLEHAAKHCMITVLREFVRRKGGLDCFKVPSINAIRLFLAIVLTIVADDDVEHFTKAVLMLKRVNKKVTASHEIPIQPYRCAKIMIELKRRIILRKMRADMDVKAATALVDRYFPTEIREPENGRRQMPTSPASLRILQQPIRKKLLDAISSGSIHGCQVTERAELLDKMKRYVEGINRTLPQTRIEMILSDNDSMSFGDADSYDDSQSPIDGFYGKLVLFCMVGPPSEKELLRFLKEVWSFEDRRHGTDSQRGESQVPRAENGMREAGEQDDDEERNMEREQQEWENLNFEMDEKDGDNGNDDDDDVTQMEREQEEWENLNFDSENGDEECGGTVVAEPNALRREDQSRHDSSLGDDGMGDSIVKNLPVKSVENIGPEASVKGSIQVDQMDSDGENVPMQADDQTFIDGFNRSSISESDESCGTRKTDEIIEIDSHSTIAYESPMDQSTDSDISDFILRARPVQHASNIQVTLASEPDKTTTRLSPVHLRDEDGSSDGSVSPSNHSSSCSTMLPNHSPSCSSTLPNHSLSYSTSCTMPSDKCRLVLKKVYLRFNQKRRKVSAYGGLQFFNTRRVQLKSFYYAPYGNLKLRQTLPQRGLFI